MDAAAGKHALKLRHLQHKFAVFGIGAKAHYALYASAVVPRAVKQHDFATGGQRFNVTLKVPLAAFLIGGLLQRHYACAAWVEVFHKAFDGAALARCIAPFKYDDDFCACFFYPCLQFEQLYLQQVFLLFVVAAAHQVFVGVAAFAPVGGKFFVRGGFAAGLGLLQHALQRGNFVFGAAAQECLHGLQFVIGVLHDVGNGCFAPCNSCCFSFAAGNFADVGWRCIAQHHIARLHAARALAAGGRGGGTRGGSTWCG